MANDAPKFDPTAPYESVSAASTASAAPASTGQAFDPNASYESAPDQPSSWSGPRGTITKGIVEGMGDTVSGVAHLIHKIPGVGETLAPQAGISALDKMTTADTTGEKIGKGIEAAAEWMIPGLAEESGPMKAARLVALSDKYPLLAKTLNLAKDHPWLAKLILEGGEGAATGGTIGAVKGAQQDQVVQGAKVGAITGAATGVVTAMAPGLKNLRLNPFRKTPAPAAAAEPGLVRKVLQGEKVAQAPAQEALRSGVQAGAETAGIADESAATNIQNQSLRTVMDEPIGRLQDAKKAVYAKVDQAVGTDLKTLYGKLDAINDKIDLEASGSPEEARLEAQRTTQMQTIEDAKQVARNKGVNADDLLNKGDAMHTQEMALRDLQKKVFNNQSVLSGNITHGTPETINIDATIKSLERLNQSTKYGPNRLAQALGPDGAKQLLNDLYAAQRLGVSAVKTQALMRNIVKWGKWPTIIGGGYVMHDLLSE